MALIGSINVQGELQGQINGARYITGVITNASAVGGQVVGMRGLQGEKGDTGDTGATGADGQDGFSPSASVSKVDNVATITITDKDGTTTANVYDGSDETFVAEYNVTTLEDVISEYNDGKHLVVQYTQNGVECFAPLQSANITDATHGTFLFFTGDAAGHLQIVCLSDNAPTSTGWLILIYDIQPKLISGTNIKTINSESLLGSGNIDIQGGGGDVTDVTVDGTSIVDSDGVAELETVTQLRDGLMTALDKQKLDGIASGAEVNVQSDWNEADSTADDYIKNKPTIPAQKVWYATCPTSASTQTKVVSTSSDDFKLTAGNLLIVKFTYANTYEGLAQLKVDGLTAKNVYHNSGVADDSYRWKGGEIVPFIYSGSVFYMLEQGVATTSYYGMTKLSDSTSSTSTTLAATANSVKTAYDEAVDATETPTASKKSKFDSDAHMNSTDMTTGADSELEDFIDGLNVSGGDRTSSTLTVSSGWTASQNWCKRSAYTVEFYIEVTGGTLSTGWNTIATLPQDYIPPSYYDFVAVENTNDTSVHGKVTATGAVQVYKASNVTNTLRVHSTHLVF